MSSLKENPPVQCPDNLAINEFADRWCVAHTRPRQEKALAWDVLRLGGSYFLPMYEVTRRSRGRQWRTILCLFPGYVFLCGNDDDRSQALATDRIANVIPVPDQARLVEELQSLQRLLASKAGIDPYPQLAKGSPCRIRSGPLAGLEGLVERRKGQTRFVVNVTILGQGASVEVDADSIDPTG